MYKIITLIFVGIVIVVFGSRFSISQITKGFNTSNPTARRTMGEFKGLEIVNLKGDLEGESDQQLYDNTEKMMLLRPEFGWSLSEEFRKLREGYATDLEYHFANDISKVEKGELIKTELKEKTPPSTLDKDITYECYYCEDFPTLRMKQNTKDL